MITVARYIIAALVLMLAHALTAFGDTGLRPAMITNGSDSVAAYLHYPKKAKEKKEEAAITFYCEIKSDGRAAHLMLYGADDKAQFRQAVLQALRAGRFQPATVDGKPVAVMIGGTAIFMFRGDQPTVAIALSTADTGKLASLSNYIQPQMLTSSADFRRKMRKVSFDTDLNWGRGVHPSAIAVADVDAQGNMTNVKITKESPAKGWCGPVLAKTFKGEKFIPAMENGKSVPGQYQLVVNYELMFRADWGSETGSHISRDDWDDNGVF
jgi:Gram-negative bacterial TonB protein C-terminal